MSHRNPLAGPSQREHNINDLICRRKDQQESSSLVDKHTAKPRETMSSSSRTFSTKGVVRCDVRNNRGRDMDPVGQRSRSSIGRQQQLQVVSRDKSKGPQLSHLLLYADEMRISKILRRLMGERHVNTATDLCKKLETAVRTQSNTAYICRSFEYLVESLILLLSKGPEECRDRLTTVLGLIGYIGRVDFSIYKTFLSKAYQSEKTSRKYFMMALKVTISCDAINLDLMSYSGRLLALLKEYLENAEQADTFIAVSDTIAEFSRHYKQSFETHFTDIVDIVVGWHLEIDQPHSSKIHCSHVLQQFSPYFLKELDFTFGLLGQFLEDLSAFGEELAASGTENSQQATQKAGARVGSFVGAFNSVLKCLATKTEFVFFTIGQNMVTDALHIIMKVAEQTLLKAAMASEEIILNINEFLALVFANYHQRVANGGDDAAPPLPSIEPIVKLELRQFYLFNDAQATSLLYLIMCFIQQQRTKLPLSMVTLVFGAYDHNPLASNKLAKEHRPYQLLLKIYQEVLMVKNVPLLQEAYRHITADMDAAILVLKQANQAVEAHIVARAETTLLFCLAALTALATQTSSIIGMYALRPSILELLIANCAAADTQLWSEFPTLHGALLRVLSVHCQKNHNYRNSSRLLSSVHSYAKHHSLEDNNSPTSENLGLILNFLAALLSQAASLNVHNLTLVLDWIKPLLDECRPSAALLQSNAAFVAICRGLGDAAHIAPLESAACIATLLDYTMLPDDAMYSFGKTALCLIDTHEKEARQAFTDILARLPLIVSLSVVERDIFQRRAKFRDLQHWYQATTHCASFRAKFFKPFLQNIDLNELGQGACLELAVTMQEECFLDYFVKSWIVQERERAPEYQQTVQHSIIMLETWLQCEVARYCVRHKLRTTLGKPQDTFLAIEAIIMRYARAIANRGTDASAHTKTLALCSRVRTQHNIRLLLGFLEYLEKHIHNAAEGTAFAMLPLEKPAKTFFRINTQTCSEWFRRIRSSVSLIALHSMEPAMAVRYAECVLRSTEKEKLTDILMDNTLITLAWGLVSCREADALQGLHVWAQARAGKRFAWIQHAAEQAAGQWERAAEGYVEQLSGATKGAASQLSVPVKEFLYDQLLDCLYNSGQWARMRTTLRQCGMDSQQLTNWRSDAHLAALDWTIYARTYDQPLDPDSPEGKALLEMTQWPKAEVNDDGFGGGNFSYYSIVPQLENICMVNVLTQSDNMPAKIQRDMREATVESLRHGSVAVAACSSQQSDLLMLNHVIQALGCDGTFLPPDCGAVGGSSALMLKCLLWTVLFARRNYGMEDTDGQHHALYLDVAASARREGNANYCRDMLERFFALQGFIDSSLPSIVEQLKLDICHVGIQDAQLLRAFDETTKWLYLNVSPAGQAEAINVSAAICRQVVELGQITNSYPPASVDMLLTLSDWLTQRSAHCSTTGGNIPQLQRLLELLPEVCELDLHNPLSVAVIPPLDRAVCRLINASIVQQRICARAWCAYGNWCYRWGKKVVEARNAAAGLQKSAHLTSRDLAALESVMRVTVDAELIQQMAAVLDSHQLHSGGDGVEDIEANEGVGSSSSIEIIVMQLRQIAPIAVLSAEEVGSIIDIWRQAHRSVYVYYENAVRAYFKYLAIQTDDCCEPLGNDDSNRHAHVEDCSFVTTTLRLLRLIVKHAVELQGVLEEGLRTTPLRPWKVIVPQLFSRLNHHEPYVRRSVSELLCRLAQDRPHLIIFPAVVGEQQEFKGAAEGAALSTCFSSLLASLAKQAPETVLHVKLLVKELKRITLLWEEYWMHAIAQLYAEYSPHFTALEAELKKVQQRLPQQQQRHQQNQQLNHINAKYQILLQFVATDVERIATVTAKPAETSYERSFQKRFDEVIRNTIAALKMPPPPEGGNPAEGWLRIKQLYQLFQQRSVRSGGGSSSTLKIADISPALSGMLNTAIAMPGVDTFEKNPIYIRSVDSNVHILPTKTKPKKLAFFGSDGRRYTYLFKGLEDLHLDERIMQFLSISNSMMARSRDAQSRGTAAGTFKAYHYSVIPLGPQSGLISWVEGVTPLFSIYKKWQQRDTAIKQQQKERKDRTAAGGSSVDAAQPPLPTRPSELFYSKLAPLLAEQKLKVSDPRKQWPLATLRRVLNELSKETPRDLLSKELWCQASSAVDWRKCVTNYSASVAVMSVIGYVIGLGDRHLDNVLIKLSTGEIVHIDYNVCFDKGKTLRVPEKVPFRMTPNLEETLGVTGVEGTFRLGCEYVMRTLRKERETLLTLLEAFVYDPLVDWTINDDDGTSTAATTTLRAPIATTTTTTRRTTSSHLAAQSLAAYNLSNNTGIGGEGTTAGGLLRLRKNDDKQDWEIVRQMIVAKFGDITAYWAKYRDDVSLCLADIDRDMRKLATLRISVAITERQRNVFTKQMAIIRDMEALGSAMGSHPLNTVTQRNDACKRANAAFDAVEKSVNQTHADLERMLRIFFTTLLNLSVPLLLPSTSLPTSPPPLAVLREQLNAAAAPLPNEFVAVRKAFYSSGFADANTPPALMSCELARQEMDNALCQESRCALQCIGALLQYAAIVQFQPLSCLKRHRIVRYYRWYGLLLTDQCTADEIAADVLSWKSEMALELARDAEPARREVARQYAAAMKQIWIDLNLDLHLAMNELAERSQREMLSVEDAIEAVNRSYTSSPRAAAALQRNMLHTLDKANAAFEQFEKKEARASGASNFCHLLDHQLDYVDIVLRMWQSVCGDGYGDTLGTTDKQHSFAAVPALQALQSALEALRDIKTAFNCELSERIVRLFMSANDNDEESPTVYATLQCFCLGEMRITPTDMQLAGEALFDVELVAEEINRLFGVFEQRLEFLKLRIDHILAEAEMRTGARPRIAQEKLLLIDEFSVDAAKERKAAIKNVFIEARKHCAALYENDVATIYDLRRIAAPLANNYVEHMQRSYLCGLTTAVVRACMCAEDRGDEVGVECSEGDKKEADMLCQQLFATLQHNAALRHYKRQVVEHTKRLEHHTLVSSAHHWYNEALLRDEADHTAAADDVHICNIVSKQNLLSIVHNTSQALTVLKQTIIKIQNELDGHIAALGHDELTMMGEYGETQKARICFYLQLTTQLEDCAGVLLYLERFEQKYSPDVPNDDAILTTMTQWRETVQAKKKTCGTLTPDEISIVQLLDPEGKVDQCWINNVTGVLDEMTYVEQRRLADFEREERALEKLIGDHGSHLQTLIDTPLRLELRHLLRLIIKSEKSAKGASQYESSASTSWSSRIRDMQQAMKLFGGLLVDLQTMLTPANDTHSLAAKMACILSAADRNYGDFIELVGRYLVQNGAVESPDHRGAFSLYASEDGTSSTNMADKKVVEQKRNAYAVSVWKRIRMKLEGRDPDPNRRSTVSEQVEYIIKEAVDKDNLAVLYEGWTPWV